MSPRSHYPHLSPITGIVAIPKPGSMDLIITLHIFLLLPITASILHLASKNNLFREGNNSSGLLAACGGSLI